MRPGVWDEASGMRPRLAKGAGVGRKGGRRRCWTGLRAVDVLVLGRPSESWSGRASGEREVAAVRFRPDGLASGMKAASAPWPFAGPHEW
eukprot:scaffold159513_cov22-Prasinocladus_malaysianus.AAC.1